MSKTKPKIIVDTREQIPWDWDSDDAFEEVIRRKLDVGDYTLEGLEDVIIIERKANVDELYMNFSKHRKREFAKFERAKDCKFKFLVLEEECDDVMNPNHYYVNKPHPKTRRVINKKSPMMPVAVVASNLTKLMIEHDVRVIFGGMRAQSMIRGILLHVYELHRKGKLESQGD